jgi:hypothetical protein
MYKVYEIIIKHQLNNKLQVLVCKNKIPFKTFIHPIHKLQVRN